MVFQDNADFERIFGRKESIRANNLMFKKKAAIG
jgi:hypothetical protein